MTAEQVFINVMSTEVDQVPSILRCMYQIGQQRQQNVIDIAVTRTIQ